MPALVPAPDWLRFRITLDGTPLLLRSGTLVAHHRALDLRRGLLTAEWHHRDPLGRTVHLRALRLVSLAERSLGFQLVQFKVDHPVHVKFEAWLEVANAGLDVIHVEPGLGLWRTAESGKRLTVASAAGLQADGRALQPSEQRHLTRVWTTLPSTSAPGRSGGPPATSRSRATRRHSGPCALRCTTSTARPNLTMSASPSGHGL